MSDPNETMSVVIKRVFKAPIDLVYRAWTEEQHVTKWMKCDPEVVTTVENWEPRVGAEVKCHMSKPGAFDASSTARIIEADPPRVFAYRIEPDPSLGAPELTVRVELKEVEGGTEMTLTHSGLPNEDFCGIVQGGWSVSLGLLDELVVAWARTGVAT